MEFHEAANIFPLDEENVAELAKDVRKRGQVVPIETFGGKIIDGRRRLRACQEASVEPKFKEIWTDDPVAYVLSLNLHRRHLTPSQLAMVGARAREIYDRQAKERQRASGGDKKNGSKAVPVNLPEPVKGDSRDQAGQAVGVSGKSIDYATKVLAQAIPEVVKAVDEGRMSISTAAILASESEEQQRSRVEVDAIGRKRSRRYSTGESAVQEDVPEPQEGQQEIKQRGVGVIRAHEAINSLIRIPKNDALRKRGFQIVTDWIKANR